ncbi:hypothetical protein BC827DRAFT_129803 [Russula dissimulans]|nr:hypothetical protein BC827DRAFT_129803 [Russula dissimulans]
MDPPFLTFSSEILIEILSHLPPRDVAACKLTCRKLRDIVAHSSLLQYIVQIFLAGVHDPLLSGAPIVERSNALHDLEVAWRDLSVHRRTAQINRGTAWPWLDYTIHDDYLIAVRGDSDEPSQPPGYSYIDLREDAAFTNPVWRRVDVPWRGQHCIFAFAANENDLAVVVTCARDEDITTVEVHCLSFVDGEPHPLAENQDLVVNFPGPSSPHHIQVQITGDHMVLSCNGYPSGEGQIDVLFLVSWKEGKVTPLRETPPPAMTFAVGCTWISGTLLAFVHMVKNAIFLYEFVEEPGRIKFIRVLELPPLCEGGRLNYAHCLSEQNPVFHHTSHTTGRLPPRFPFRYNPADGIACFILGVSLEGIPGASMSIAIVVPRRTLVALASTASTSTFTSTSTSTSNSASSADAGAPDGQQQPVPWDSWGPTATRCLEVPYWRRCGGPVGQRWGILARDKFILHDFNPHNVRRAAAELLALASAPPAGPAPGTSTGVKLPHQQHQQHQQHENGNRTRVVTAPTVLTAGLCFRGDVTSRLPYVETRAVCTPRWESVLLDGERLLGLYFKEEGDATDAHKVDIDVYIMGTGTGSAATQ